MNGWVVLVNTGEAHLTAYGPFADANEAAEFCRFAQEEIDPAYIGMLRSPVGEVLAWRRARTGEVSLKS